MADGTSVGFIFLDLIVRDTVEKQVQNMAAKAQTTAQNAFSGVEKTAEGAEKTIAASMAKTVEQTAQSTQKLADDAMRGAKQITQSVARDSAAAGEAASASLENGFNKAVALAQARVNELEREYERVSNRLADVNWSYSYNDDGDRMTDKLAERLAAQREELYDKLASARERLAIQIQAAAEKQKTAEISAAQTTTEKLEAEAAKQRAAIAQAHTAADPPAATPPQVQSDGTGRQVSVWSKLTAAAGRFGKTALGAFASVAKGSVRLIGRLFGINKLFDRSGTSARRFGSRLREIASGALIFNGISTALRSMVGYLKNTIASTDQMKSALANLKGAAANAASPIIQVLTPALTALANTAATVFSYVAKLLTLFTGKVSNAASAASKSAGAAKKAMASLAGFDEIQRLDSKDSGGSETIEPNYNFEGKSPFLDEVTAAIEAGRWDQVGKLIAQKLNGSLEKVNWAGIQDKAVRWTQNLVDAINGFANNLNWGQLGSGIGNGLNTILSIIDTFFQGTDWVSLGQGFGDGLNGLFKTVDWAMLGRVLTDKFKALFELLHGFVSTFDFGEAGRSLAEMLMAGLGNIDWQQLLNDICAGIIGLSEMLTEFVLAIDWQKLGNDVADCLASIDWSGLFTSICTGIGAALGGLFGFLWGIIEDAWNSMMDTWLENTEKCGGDVVAGLLLGILEGLADIVKWLWDNLVMPIVDGVKQGLGIHSPSTVFAEIGENLILGLLNGISAIWNSIVEFFSNAFNNLKRLFSDTWESIKATVSNVFGTIKTTITNIWNSIASAIKGVINGIIGSINGMISGIVNGINSVIRALNMLKFDIPDWVPVLGGKEFGFSITPLTAPQIPMLANGGVITQPTLAMMGEYSGARGNPEIVAPQSIIEETVANVMRDIVDKNQQNLDIIIGVLREILEAVLGIEIDGEALSRAVESYNRKMAVVRGG